MFYFFLGTADHYENSCTKPPHFFYLQKSRPPYCSYLSKFRKKLKRAPQVSRETLIYGALTQLSAGRAHSRAQHAYHGNFHVTLAQSQANCSPMSHVYIMGPRELPFFFSLVISCLIGYLSSTSSHRKFYSATKCCIRLRKTLQPTK